jgi:hypothetical protein
MISAAQKGSFREILTILDRHGLPDHLILIGSLSEYIHEGISI